MKRGISYVFLLIVSIFMFSGRVDAVNMYMECNYSCSGVCADLLTTKKNANEFAIITDQKGNTTHYALEEGAGGLYAWKYDDEYGGCWADNGSDDFFGTWCYEDLDAYDILGKGICPKCACAGDIADLFSLFTNSWTDRINEQEFGPAGVGDSSSINAISKITDDVYVVYSFKDGSGKERILMEGYTADGRYAFVGPHLDGFWADDGVAQHQLYNIEKFGGDYWKVHEKEETRIIFSKVDVNSSKDSIQANVCKGVSAGSCNYTVLFDSNDKNGKIKELVLDWYEENQNLFSGDSQIFSIIEASPFNDACEEINTNLSQGKSYKFGNSYNIEMLVSDLERAYKALVDAYSDEFKFKDYTNEGSKTQIDDSILTKMYADVFKNTTLQDIAYGSGSKYKLNDNYLVKMLHDDVKLALQDIVYGEDVPEINITNIGDYLGDYTLIYYTTVSYLDANQLLFDLDSSLSNRVKTLRLNFEKLVEKHKLDIFPVVDCKGLLGQDLIDKINSYLDIIKIIIPIILIGYGVIDFTKAIFSGEDDMRKAQTSFFKRIGIAVIIFITPSIVNLILNLANKVWPIISPNSCGIFE